MKDIVLCINDEFTISIDIEYIAKFYVGAGAALADANKALVAERHRTAEALREVEATVHAAFAERSEDAQPHAEKHGHTCKVSRP